MRQYFEHPLFALLIIAFGFALHLTTRSLGVASPSSEISLFGASPLDSLRRESARIENRIEYLTRLDNELQESVPANGVSRQVQDLSTQIGLIERHIGNAGVVETADLEQPQLTAVLAQQEKYAAALSHLVDMRQQMIGAIPDLTPTTGIFSSGFGERIHPVTGVRRKHTGVDLAAPKGTPITAASSGTVIFAGVKSGYGNTVMIDHGYGYTTLYGHSSKLLVKVGDKVTKGDEIALVGSTGVSTGPHLHYEVIVDSTKINPMAFLRQPPVMIASAKTAPAPETTTTLAANAKKSAKKPALAAKKGTKTPAGGSLAAIFGSEKGQM